jgi:hypothetical protein
MSLVAGPASAVAQDRPTDASLSGAIRGSVTGRFQGGTRALGFAEIQVTSGSGVRAVPADSLGRYSVDGLPPGRIVLRASHPGHKPVELAVSVPRSGVVNVDLELEGSPIELEPVDVLGRSAGPVPEPGSRPERLRTQALSEVEMQTLDLAPGVGHEGLLDAVRALPGNDPSDASDVLYMRGSTTDLKLVLLDGVPVYTPFHVAGLMRTFEPAVLGSAKLHVGGAPARFDGGLTHILQLETRSARRDRARASGSFDLLAASTAVEMPLGADMGVLASTRSLHDVGSTLLGGDRPYGYRDALIAFDADPADGHRFEVTAFTNEESVLLDYELSSEDARWANVAGTLAYTRDFEGARLVTRIGASGYQATLPLRPTRTSSDSTATTFLADGASERVRVESELAWGSSDAPFRAGVSHERITAAFVASSTSDDRISENRGRTERTGLFLEASRPLSDGVTLQGGFRADYFPDVGFVGAPRAAIRWEVSPEMLLTVAAGRYHQPTRNVDPAVELTLLDVSEVGLAPEEVLPVATADHVVLSLDQRLGSAARMGLEGFFKRFDGLDGSGRETVRSSGVDVRILTASERTSAWVGYGLSWFWSGTDLSGRTSDFSGRHLLTAGVSGGIAGPISGEARLSYGAGLPYTSVPIPTAARDELINSDSEPQTLGPARGTAGAAASTQPLVAGLDEEFLRVDLELHALFEPEWGGRAWTVRPYVRVLNALDRRDAMFYALQPWRDEGVTPLATRPLLPLIGLAFSF